MNVEDAEAEDAPASFLPGKGGGAGNGIIVSPMRRAGDEADNSSAACGKRFASSPSEFEGRFTVSPFVCRKSKLTWSERLAEQN